MTIVPYTKTPNAILEAMPDMSEAELKLTAVLIRLTYGYHKNKVRMTYEDMETAAGISRGSVYNAIERIENRGFFRRGRRSYWFINSTKSELFEVGESTDYELNDKEKSTKSELGKSTKSEPPSIYKEKEEKENIYTPYINSGIATDAQIMPIVNALKGVAKERYTNGRHQKFDDVALTIFHDGATPEDVTKFGEWWKRNCWYDPPTPASLLTIADEWQNFVNGVERPSPNGNGHNQDPNLVEFAVFPEGF